MSHSLRSGSGAEEAGIFSSISVSFWSRSISMMSGTARIRKVVSAIHAALLVLRRSFLDTTAALEAARSVWMTMDD